MFSSNQRFRLVDRPSDLGLDCGQHGLSLAGVPLLYRPGGAFRPRSDREVDWLISRAYQKAFNSPALVQGLNAVADALNDGLTARAMIVAVLLKLPELDWDGAVRIAEADETLAKFYHRDQPRDDRGRWTSGPGWGARKSKGLPHHYLYQTLVCVHSDPRCTIENAWHGLLRNAYPGQDPMAGPIPPEGGDHKVFNEPNGPIHTSVDADALTVTNDTLEGHIFYKGTVNRSVVETPTGIFIRTEGAGTNPNIHNWVENHAAGALGFQGADSNIRAYITDPGFYDRTKR